MVSGLPEVLRLLSNTVIMQTLAQGQATAIFSSPLKKKKKIWVLKHQQQPSQSSGKQSSLERIET